MAEEPVIDLSQQIQFVDLVIICRSQVGDYALELIDLVKDLNRNFQARGGKMVLNLVGIISWDKSLIGKTYSGIAVLGDFSVIQDYLTQSKGVPINGMLGDRDPADRREIIENTPVKDGGVSFPSIVHPTAVAGSDVKLGKGNIIFPFTYVAAGAEIGDFCSIQSHCSVGVKYKLQDFTNVEAHSSLLT